MLKRHEGRSRGPTEGPTFKERKLERKEKKKEGRKEDRGWQDVRGEVSKSAGVAQERGTEKGGGNSRVQ